MRLHETHIHDITLRVQQIHVELQNLYLEFQSLKKEKAAWPEAREEVWCLKCKNHGHDNDHWLVFRIYMARGGPMHLRQEAHEGPSKGPALLCDISQGAGKHVTDNCHLLQIFVHMSQQ